MNAMDRGIVGCAAGAALLAVTGCNALDGLADVPAIAVFDGGRDATSPPHHDGGIEGGADHKAHDAMPTKDASPDVAHDASACGEGGAQCGSSCVDLQSSSAHCGACGHNCNGAVCTAGACGVYAVVTGNDVGKAVLLATDGTRVVWVDDGFQAIEQVPAAGGTETTLVPPSATNGTVSSELALANGTVAFAYGGATPQLGLAAADVGDSGVPYYPGGVAIDSVSLDPNAGEVFFVNVEGTQGSLMKCPINSTHGITGGTCSSLTGGGRFLDQTAADSTYLFYSFQSGGASPSGLFLDVFNGDGGGQISSLRTNSLAVGGGYAYWTQAEDGGTTYSVQRLLETTGASGSQLTAAQHLSTEVFTTDGTTVFYGNATGLVSRPAAGGTVTTIAAGVTPAAIAVGGGLLVWTDSTGSTISGLVLP